jgi:hypothetical protein
MCFKMCFFPVFVPTGWPAVVRQPLHPFVAQILKIRMKRLPRTKTEEGQEKFYPIIHFILVEVNKFFIDL